MKDLQKNAIVRCLQDRIDILKIGSHTEQFKKLKIGLLRSCIHEVEVAANPVGDAYKRYHKALMLESEGEVSHSEVVKAFAEYNALENAWQEKQKQFQNWQEAI